MQIRVAALPLFCILDPRARHCKEAGIVWASSFSEPLVDWWVGGLVLVGSLVRRWLTSYKISRRTGVVSVLVVLLIYAGFTWS